MAIQWPHLLLSNVVLAVGGKQLFYTFVVLSFEFERNYPALNCLRLKFQYIYDLSRKKYEQQKICETVKVQWKGYTAFIVDFNLEKPAKDET